jgi:hypothetical protein
MADDPPVAPPLANPPAAPIDAGAPIHSTDRLVRRLTLATGFVFLFAMVAIGMMLFAVTGGGFLPAHWVAFYILVALVTGLAFWLITGATGEFSWKDLGWKLTGGAAIGIIFMFAAHKLTPEPPPNVRVIEVVIGNGIEPFIAGFENGTSRVIRIPNEPRYLVEFREGAMTGEVHFRYLGPNGERVTRTYTVPRVGVMGEPRETTEK